MRSRAHSTHASRRRQPSTTVTSRITRAARSSSASVSASARGRCRARIRAALAAIGAVRAIERPTPLRALRSIPDSSSWATFLPPMPRPITRSSAKVPPSRRAFSRNCARDAVVISEATRVPLGDLFECRGDLYRRVWQVLGDSSTVNRFAALRRKHAELLGRDEEIDVLRCCWSRRRRARVGSSSCGASPASASRASLPHSRSVSPATIGRFATTALRIGRRRRCIR